MWRTCYVRLQSINSDQKDPSKKMWLMHGIYKRTGNLLKESHRRQADHLGKADGPKTFLSTINAKVLISTLFHATEVSPHHGAYP